jgi:hypothetical protein
MVHPICAFITTKSGVFVMEIWRQNTMRYLAVLTYTKLGGFVLAVLSINYQ